MSWDWSCGDIPEWVFEEIAKRHGPKAPYRAFCSNCRHCVIGENYWTGYCKVLAREVPLDWLCPNWDPREGK